MAVKRMSSIIAVLMVIAISGFFVLCSECQVDAMVDPSPSEEQAKAASASASSQTQTDASTASKKTKTKKKSSESAGNNSQSASASDSSVGNAQSGSNDSSDSDDEDVVDENAFTTPGNATLGDMIKSSGSKDFYTIRTDNDNTFYLVIDHSGNMDNVYMLSAIDENDLKDFLEEDAEDSGSIVLPETVQPEQSESEADTAEKEPEKNSLPGIISLVLLIAGGIVGAVMFRKYRREAEEPEADYSENMEDDGLPTVNEDEEFLE